MTRPRSCGTPTSRASRPGSTTVIACTGRVDAVYTSPYLHAERGSTHGYDIVDHGRLGPELGSEADYVAWTDGLRARGNHMGIGSGENRWWNDVLESGMASPGVPDTYQGSELWNFSLVDPTTAAPSTMRCADVCCRRSRARTPRRCSTARSSCS